MSKRIRLNHLDLKQRLAWVYFTLKTTTEGIDHYKPSSRDNLIEMSLGTVGSLLAEVLSDEEKVKLYSGTLELEDIQG